MGLLDTLDRDDPAPTQITTTPNRGLLATLDAEVAPPAPSGPILFPAPRASSNRHNTVLRARAMQAEEDADAELTGRQRRKVVIVPDDMTATELQAGVGGYDNPVTKFAMGAVRGASEAVASVPGAITSAVGDLADSPSISRAGRSISKIGGVMDPLPGTESDASGIIGTYAGGVAPMLSGPAAAIITGGTQAYASGTEEAMQIQEAKRRAALQAQGLDPAVVDVSKQTPQERAEEIRQADLAGRAGYISGGLGAVAGAAIPAAGRAAGTFIGRKLVGKAAQAAIEKAAIEGAEKLPEKLASAAGAKYIGKQAAFGSIVGGVTGGAQQAAQNIGIANSVDLKRSVLHGVPEAVVGGALAGGAVEGAQAARILGSSAPVQQQAARQAAEAMTSDLSSRVTESLVADRVANQKLSTTDGDIRAQWAAEGGNPADLDNEAVISAIRANVAKGVQHAESKRIAAQYGNRPNEDFPSTWAEDIQSADIHSPTELQGKFPRAESLKTMPAPEQRALIRRAYKGTPTARDAEALVKNYPDVDPATNPIMDDVYRGLATLNKGGHDYTIVQAAGRPVVSLGPKSVGDKVAVRAVEAINRGLNGLASQPATAIGPSPTVVASAAERAAGTPSRIRGAEALIQRLKDDGHAALRPSAEKAIKDALDDPDVRAKISIGTYDDPKSKVIHYFVLSDDIPAAEKVAKVIRDVTSKYRGDAKPVRVEVRRVRKDGGGGPTPKSSPKPSPKTPRGGQPPPKVAPPKTEGAGEGAPITPTQPEVKIPEAAETTTPPSPAAKTTSPDIVSRLEAAAEDARARIDERAKGRKGRVQTGVDPTIAADIKDWAIIGAAKIARGVKDFAQWSDSMVRKFGASIKPHLQEVWDASHSRLTVEELKHSATTMASWRDWYDRHQKVIDDLFGDDAPVFKQLLSATSQANTVPGNVTLALKAYRQLVAGAPFDGYLAGVKANLERIRAETAIQGPKISAFGDANKGDASAIPVDRHISYLLFDSPSPTAEQRRVAVRMIQKTAARLGWEPREVQAALWAFNQVRMGTNPESVRSYDTILKERADEIRSIRSDRELRPADETGAGGGVPAGVSVGEGVGVRKAEAGDIARGGVRDGGSVREPSTQPEAKPTGDTEPPSPASMGARSPKKPSAEALKRATSAIRNEVQQMLGDRINVAEAPSRIASESVIKPTGEKRPTYDVMVVDEIPNAPQKTGALVEDGKGGGTIYIRSDAAHFMPTGREEAGAVVRSLLKARSPRQYDILRESLGGTFERDAQGFPINVEGPETFQRLVQAIKDTATGDKVTPEWETVREVQPHLLEGMNRELDQIMGTDDLSMNERMDKAFAKYGEGVYAPRGLTEAVLRSMRNTWQRATNALRGSGWIAPTDILGAGGATGDIAQSGYARPQNSEIVQYLSRAKVPVKGDRSDARFMASVAGHKLGNLIVREAATWQGLGAPAREAYQSLKEIVNDRFRQASKPVEEAIISASRRIADQPDYRERIEAAFKILANEWKGDPKALERLEKTVDDQKLLDAVWSLRGFLDHLSGQLPESGLIREAVIETVNGNLSRYVPRLFAIDLMQGKYHSKSYANRVWDAYESLAPELPRIRSQADTNVDLTRQERAALTVDRAIRKVANDKELLGAKDFDGLSDVERRRMAQSYIFELMRRRDPSLSERFKDHDGVSSMGDMGEALDRLKKKNLDLPKEFLDLFGEIRDPAVAGVHAIRSLQELLGTGRFLMRLRDARRPDGTKYFWDSPEEASRATGMSVKNFVKIPGDQASNRGGQWAPIEGKWTTPDVMYALDDALPSAGVFGRVARSITKVSQTVNTIFRPASMVANALQDFGPFAAINGVSPLNPANVGIWKQALRDAKNLSGPLYERFSPYLEFQRTALTEDRVMDSNLADVTDKYILGEITGDSALGRIASRARKMGGNVWDTTARWYGYTSRALRLASAEKRYQQNGGDAREAAEWVNALTPSYVTVPKAIRRVDASIGAPMFLKFLYESNRILANAMRKNPVGLGLVLAAGYGLKEGLTTLSDDSEREAWDQATYTLPPGAHVPIRRIGPDGKPMMNAVNIARFSTELENAQMIEDMAAGKSGADVLFSKFGNNPPAQMLSLAITGKDFTGRYEDAGEGVANRAGAVGKVALESMLPSLVTGSDARKLSQSGLVPPYGVTDPRFGLPRAQYTNRQGTSIKPEDALSGVTTGITPQIYYADVLFARAIEKQSAKIDAVARAVNKIEEQRDRDMAVQATEEGRKQVRENARKQAQEAAKDLDGVVDEYRKIKAALQAQIKLGFPVSPNAAKNAQSERNMRALYMRATKLMAQSQVGAEPKTKSLGDDESE